MAGMLCAGPGVPVTLVAAPLGSRRLRGRGGMFYSSSASTGQAPSPPCMVCFRVSQFWVKRTRGRARSRGLWLLLSPAEPPSVWGAGVCWDVERGLCSST